MRNYKILDYGIDAISYDKELMKLDVGSQPVYIIFTSIKSSGILCFCQNFLTYVSMYFTYVFTYSYHTPRNWKREL